MGNMDTDDTATQLALTHDAAKHRYEARAADGSVVSVADYVDTRATGVPQDSPVSVRRFFHTETAPMYGGRGFAGRLVRFALDDTVAQGLQIQPACSYVADFVAVHHEWDDSLAD